MEEISLIAKKRMEYRLETIKEELITVAEAMEQARGLGDFSENSEYEATSAKYTSLTIEKAEIEEILNTRKVITNFTNSIGIGTLLSVKMKNEDGTWDDKGLLLFDEKGSALFDGTISPQSNLGRKIEGGLSGEYVFQDLRGHDRVCQVTIEPESRIEEYLEQYNPDRSITLSRIFDK